MQFLANVAILENCIYCIGLHSIRMHIHYSMDTVKNLNLTLNSNETWCFLKIVSGLRPFLKYMTLLRISTVGFSMKNVLGLQPILIYTIQYSTLSRISTVGSWGSMVIRENCISSYTLLRISTLGFRWNLAIFYKLYISLEFNLSYNYQGIEH